MNAVIIGGGILGLSTAYYLLASPSLPSGSSVTIIERTAIAHAASGRAMGMIGREWQPKHTLSLSRLSWQCYEELDRAYGGEQWEWMRSPTLGVEVQEGASLSRYRDVKKKGAAQVPGGEVFNGEAYTMDEGDAVGHVNPAKFCAFLLRICTELGLKVILDHPLALNSTAQTLTLSSTSGPLPYTHLVIAAGPWAAHVCEALGLPVPSISNLPGHSIHIQPAPGGWDPTLVGKSIFAGVTAGMDGEEALNEVAWHGGEKTGNSSYTPAIELVTRPRGEVYIAGENGVPSSSSKPGSGLRNSLPTDPGEVESLVTPSLVNRLCRSAAALSNGLDVRKGAKLVSSQLCYRPTTPDGSPLLGWLDEPGKVLIGAGHGPWGITLGPGSGKVIAEMALGVKLSAPVAAFRPSRFKLT